MTWFLVFEFFGNKRRNLIGIVDTYEKAIRLSLQHSHSIIDEYESNVPGNKDESGVELIATYNCEGKIINI